MGIVLLMGIVKKSSIILVGHAIEVRGGHGEGAGEAMDARAAMLRAGPVRLRPTLMTSIATLMAAVPSALALGPGAEIRAPMAAAVIGGLLVSTALSLLVVPAFYVLADDVQGRVARLRTRRAGRSAPASTAHPATPQQ
ncbi:efflux RND transporter permease subunit [Sorangium sp. So ce269]